MRWTFSLISATIRLKCPNETKTLILKMRFRGFTYFIALTNDSVSILATLKLKNMGNIGNVKKI